MKGIILAGGTGSRLFPLTKITNKHLLPVYDKPMICYPLNTLIDAGIDDIMIVSGRGHVGHFLELLGSGSELGVRLSYEIQDGAGGIAQALGLARRWAADDAVTVILGDNIFEDCIKDAVQSFKSGARIFLKEVPDAQRFGVAEVSDNRIIGIEEKPKHPKTNLAVTGLYIYDSAVFEIIKELKPSGRGELEITDVNNAYVHKGTMTFSLLSGFWSDAGTFDSLLHASIQVKEHRNKPGHLDLTSMPPLVSVVVVNFNGKKFLDDCLSSLVRQTFRDFETILVDNGSSDGSADYIRERYPSVMLVETGKNLGFAGGTNAGIRAAQGEFVFTLNNDTVADPCMLEEIVKPMQAEPTVGMCGTKMVLPDGRINSTAICLSRSGAAWDRGMGEADHGQFDTAEETFGPCAGAALYRRLMLDDIGLFDEDFFLFMEDVDLAFRGRLAGWKCMYVPTAQVVHVHGGTAGFRSDLSVYYGNRNLVWYVIKNFPMRTLLLSSPWIIGRNCGVIPHYFLQRKGSVIIRAKMDMIKGLPAMKRKRRDIKQRVPSIEIEKWIAVWCHASKP